MDTPLVINFFFFKLIANEVEKPWFIKIQGPMMKRQSFYCYKIDSELPVLSIVFDEYNCVG